MYYDITKHSETIQMDEIKEELLFLINSKINNDNLNTRAILKKFTFLNHMLLNRITHYKIDELKLDKIINLLHNVDLVIHDRIFPLKVNLDLEQLSFSLIYQCE